jgi:hypothetical protein
VPRTMAYRVKRKGRGQLSDKLLLWRKGFIRSKDGKGYSSNLGNRTLYRNQGYTRPTLNSLNIEGKGDKWYTGIGPMQDTPGAKFRQFSNGKLSGNGNITLNSKGNTFVLSK